MASEVGSGQVAIYPVFKGFRRAVGSEVDASAKAGSDRFKRGFRSAGQGAGKDAGTGFKKAFGDASKNVSTAATSRIKADVASASKALSTARLKEQDAAGKSRVAEAALTEARAKNVAGSARLVAAEERAASAARALSAAQDTTKSASSRLADAHANLKSATDGVSGATTRSAGGFRTATTALSGLRNVAGGVGKLIGAGLGLGLGLVAVHALSSAVGRLTGYIKDSITTAAQWEVLNKASAAVIKSTGGAARVTAGHVYNLSQRLENATATEAESIQQGANLLLTFKGIRNEAGKGNKVFDQTTAVAVDMAKALGISVPAAAMQLGKALNDPSKGLTKLARSGVTFTDQQAAQVKALVATGRTMEAQKIILRELNSEFGGQGAAYAATYEGALYRIRDAAGDFGASIASKALPAIAKLLGTGADLINWAAGTSIVQQATANIATGVGRIADRVKTFTSNLNAADLAPFLDKVKTTFATVQQTVGSVLKTVGPALAQIGPALGDSLQTLGPVLGSALQTLAPTLAQIIPELTKAAVEILPAVAEIIKAIAPLLPPIAGVIAQIAPPLADLLQNVIIPLIQNQTGLLSFFNSAAKGGITLGLAVSAMNGKFGLFVQIISNVGAAVGTAVGLMISRFNSVVGTVGRVAGAIGSFVSNAIGFFGRLQTGITVAIGRAIQVVASLPTRAASALGSLGARLFGSGAALIDGFISGIRSRIAAVTGVVGNLMSAVGKFFPHSPAETGPFSGRGWTLYSGQATVEGFAAGMTSRTGKLRSSASSVMSAAALAASTGTTAARGASGTAGGSTDRPIYSDGIGLIGWVRELANGQAELVWNKKSDQLSTGARLGNQGQVFV